jgi:hypothetical protein
MTCLGCNFIETSPVVLRTGETVCSSCEDWRLECEAREVLKRDLDGRRDYLGGVDEKRGRAAGDYLRAEILAQWKAKKTT